jgi:hypothetical protein
MTDTAELQRRVDGWRQWVRFIFTHLSAEEISTMTDRELQAIVCESAGANREMARQNGQLPQAGDK